MKKIIFTLVLSLGLSASAFATQRFQASQENCAALQSVLQEDGSIEIKHFLGYNTYYSDPSSCAFGEHAITAFEGSSDVRFCRVGYACQKDTRANSESTPDALMDDTTVFRCYAGDHEVHVKPVVWGDDAPTLKAAQDSALNGCFKELGFAASCAVQECFPESK